MIQQMVRDLINWGWSQGALAKKIGSYQPSIFHIYHGNQDGLKYEAAKALEKLWKQEKRKHG